MVQKQLLQKCIETTIVIVVSEMYLFWKLSWSSSHRLKWPALVQSATWQFVYIYIHISFFPSIYIHPFTICFAPIWKVDRGMAWKGEKAWKNKATENRLHRHDKRKHAWQCCVRVHAPPGHSQRPAWTKLDPQFLDRPANFARPPVPAGSCTYPGQTPPRPPLQTKMRSPPCTTSMSIQRRITEWKARMDGERQGRIRLERQGGRGMVGEARLAARFLTV